MDSKKKSEVNLNRPSDIFIPPKNYKLYEPDFSEEFNKLVLALTKLRNSIRDSLQSSKQQNEL